MQPQFVDAQELENLEQYSAALLWGMGSLRTLELYHLNAIKKGLLEEDETECSLTICWEIKRLLALYKKQLENVVERSPFDEDKALAELRNMIPHVKIPKNKQKTKKEKVENAQTNQ